MIQLSSIKSSLLLLIIPLLLAAPVFAQEDQRPTHANEATTLGQSAAIESPASLTKCDQKKALVSVKNKLIAEKEKLWTKEQKPVSTTDANDAEQEKPSASAAVEDDTAELAKKLANPVASLISVPMQSNFDFRMGAGAGWRSTLNVQPVIPIALSPQWT